MNKKKALNILKSVNYPGFSRDIVSFGIVQDIEFEGEIALVSVNITTADDDKRKEILDGITGALKGHDGVADVKFKLTEQPKKIPAGTAGGVFDSQAVIGEVKHTIAVASGKGGVGKSTVASNLAVALAENGSKVGLLDCDVYGPSIPTIMGINEKPRVSGGKKILPVERHGIKLMSLGFLLDENAPVIWRGPIVAKLISQFIEDIEWGELDYLVMDLPPGTGDVQLTLAQKVKLTGAIIVTTPQDLALLDADKGAAMFREVKAPVLGIVENMSVFHCPGCGAETEIFGAGGGEREALKLGVPFLGKIPIEPAVRIAGDEGTPVTLISPESASAQAFKDIAERVSLAVESYELEAV